MAKHFDAEVDLSKESSLEAPTSTRASFSSGLTLSPEAASELMSRRYCTVVGILGPPDAGKTAVLVSLYLLLSKDKLAGFQFRDSSSLMVFDEISRGARIWNSGNPPDQMTLHTERGDERAAGFLHLQLRQIADQRTSDLLLPDLPGEWSNDLVNLGDFGRFKFLKRADVIWLIIDGHQLSSQDSRMLAVHRTKLYLRRLSEFLEKPPRVLLVITRSDLGIPEDHTLEQIVSEAKALGINLEVLNVASFGINKKVPPGTGIPELVAATLISRPVQEPFWPESDDISSNRAMLQIARKGLLS